MEVRRLTAESRTDFFRLHSDENGAGWCFCVAWWARTWEGWGERTAEQNRTFREALLDRCDQYDGYLLYVDDQPVGWCQAGPRDRLGKLTRQYQLEPDPDTWALTCFLIVPTKRGQGLATYLLQEVLGDLRARGVTRVEAFPKRGAGLTADDLWTGPEVMFRAAGFVVVRDDPTRPVLALSLA